MDATIKTHIIRYIRINYKFTESGLLDFYLISLNTGGKVSLSKLYDEIGLLFGISTKELSKYIIDWVDLEVKNFKDKKKDPKVMELTESQINATKVKMIFEHNINKNITHLCT